jgi:NAD dependent epimerase/dehydratase family enzyme
MKLVIAGGTGSLGRRVADRFADDGAEVVILTRRPRPSIRHRQISWDGETAGDWADELDGAALLNLAGELVDRRPTKRTSTSCEHHESSRRRLSSPRQPAVVFPPYGSR